MKTATYLPVPQAALFNTEALHNLFTEIAQLVLLDLTERGHCIFDFEEHDMGDLVNDAVLRSASEFSESQQDLSSLAVAELFTRQENFLDRIADVIIHNPNVCSPFHFALSQIQYRTQRAFYRMIDLQDEGKLETGITDVVFVASHVAEHLTAKPGEESPRLTAAEESSLQVYMNRVDLTILDVGFPSGYTRNACDITGTCARKKGMTTLFCYDMTL